MFQEQLSVAGHDIHAISAGGIETCYHLPGFDLCLDIGRCPPGAERANRLLLTHAHIDHAAGLPYYVSLRGLIGAPPPRVFCPAADRDALWHILEAWSALQADSDRCELIGVEPGEKIELGRSVYAQTFRSPHRIATLGYTLVRRVKKLRPDLEGRAQTEIAVLARSGETVTTTREIQEVCFPGDTRIEVVEKEPSVTQAKVLLLECTFLGADISPEQAAQRGHIHLQQIADRADDFKNEVVVLTHFSRRYSREQIKAEVQAVLPESLRERIVLLFPDG